MANIRGFLGAASVAAIAAVAMSSAALADDDRKFGYSITLTGVSDYLFRGVSYTSGDPAFQPFIEFTYGNPNLTWYLDLWGSNVKDCTKGGPGFCGNPWELDIYAGVRPVTGPVNWDIGVLYYMNPDADHASDLDYVEFKVGATWSPITNLTLGATGYVTPDQCGASSCAAEQTETLEVVAAYQLPDFWKFTPTVSGLFGTTSGQDTAAFYGESQYNYWNAGLKLSVDKYFMDFRYWDTDLTKTNLPDGSGAARFLFSAGVNLP